MPATALTSLAVGHLAPVELPASPTAGDATNGNTILNGGNTVLHITNGGASARTISVAFGSTVDGQTVTPISLAIGASKSYVYKLGSPAVYGATATITVSHTDVKVTPLAIEF